MMVIEVFFNSLIIKFLQKYFIKAMADKFLVDPGEFLHIFLKNSEELINFLEHIHKVVYIFLQFSRPNFILNFYRIK